MVRSGNYEVDAEGNLVEVGSATAVADAAAADAAGVDAVAPEVPRESGEQTPIPVRRAMRVYGLAQLISFAILLVMAISKPDIRGILLIVAAVYAVVALGMHRLYRRALMRRYAKR